MFTLRSHYEDALNRLHRLQRQHAALIDQWNTLVERVNKKGGEDFLKKGVVISLDEVRSLITLCHPDKHGGKESATRMTQRLIEIRSKLE